MPSIFSVSTFNPPNELPQQQTAEFAKELFQENFRDIERLLTVFENGHISKRHFAVPLSWFETDHSLQERNDLYIEKATAYSAEVITSCLSNTLFLKKAIPFDEIEAIFFVSSSGFSTPSIDARIMNVLPFSRHTKRIPIWGLGCAGGASGINRAYEYCLAYPNAKVLVVCTELCSLTFQRNDRTKSNLIGTSLFADGVAAAVVAGAKVEKTEWLRKETVPKIVDICSALMPQSEDVMGWEVKDNGLHVVFSKNIPSIISKWLEPIVEQFLRDNVLNINDIQYFVAHPGGKKVLDAYEKGLHFSENMTTEARKVLNENGNMSSPTVLYVLHEFMKKAELKEGNGLLAALGPGFSAELTLLKWTKL